MATQDIYYSNINENEVNAELVKVCEKMEIEDRLIEICEKVEDNTLEDSIYDDELIDICCLLENPTVYVYINLCILILL